MGLFSSYKAMLRITGVALLIFVLFFYFTARQATITSNTAYWISHTQEVLFHTEKLLFAATNIETASGAFLVTRQQSVIKIFMQSRADYYTEIKTLASLTQDNRFQQTALATVDELCQQKIAYADSLVSIKKDIDITAALQLVNQEEQKNLTIKIIALIAGMQREEDRLLQVRKKNNADAVFVQKFMHFFSIFAMLILLLYILWKEKYWALKKAKSDSGLLLSNMLTSAPDAMIIADDKNEIVYFNEQAEKLYGYKAEDLKGLPLDKLIDIEQATAREKSIIEQYAKRKSGTLFPVELSIAPIKTEEKSFLLITTKDVSERNHAAELLRKSEEFFRVLVTSVTDYAIFMLDMDGKIASWNIGAEKIKGYKEREIIGKSFELFYSKEDISKGEPFHNLDMARKHGHFEKEGWRIRKNGSRFWANVVFTALRNKEGTIYGYCKITRDITERKQAHEQLEFLSRQIDQSNDAIYIVDADRKLKSWNKGAENLYGYKKEEVIGRDPNELLETALTEEEISAALNEISMEDYWTGELKRKTKSGKIIFVHSSTTAVRDEQGHVTGYVASSFNITAHKLLLQQVNHLANIVEQSSEAIFSRGRDQKIISWNKGAEKLFGIGKVDAIGKIFGELNFTRLLPEEIKKIEQQIIEYGHWQSEMEYYNTNGGSFFGSVTANLIYDAKGEIFSFNFIIKDISARKQLELKLQLLNDELEKRVAERTNEIYKKEKRFRVLVENNYDIISLLDKSLKIIYRSPSVTRVMGFLPGEMTNLEGIDNVHPEDREYAKSIIAQSFSNPGKPLHATFRRQHKDGHYIWLEGIVTNLLHDEEVYAIVTNFRDITEQKEAVEKLAASEIRFRSLIENINDAIVLNDDQFNILYQSPSVQRILGYTADERKGKQVLDYIHPDDSSGFIDMYEKLKTLPGKPVPFQYQVKSKRGDYRWIEGIVTNLMHHPAVNAYVANYRDITERKLSEEKLRKSEVHYRMLVEQSVDGIFLSDATGNYIDVNTAGCKMLGYEKIQIMQMTIADIIQPSEITRIAYEIKRLANGAIATSEWQFRRKDGSVFVGEVTGRMLPDGRLQAILRDITERKKIEKTILNLNAELEQRVLKRTAELKKANEEMEAFSYSVSHDLRAPLRAINGFTSKLDENYVSQLDEEARRIIGVVRRNTLQMGHLIDDLLSFSRMGRQEIHKATIDTASMVNELIEVAKNSNDHEVEWTIHPLHTVSGDRNTIRQVWINLISNAVKYSAKVNTARIEIGSYKKDAAIVFYVKDNGIGFNEKYKHKLFKVFQRLHSADDFEGTGIGLAIVEKIISKHNGAVWVDAAVNEGACFSFSLPG